jgi:hypothetical protein
MQNLISALADGARMARRPWLVLPLYLCATLAGLAQTWPILSVGGSAGLRNPFLGELAGGGIDPLLDLAFVTGETLGPWLLSSLLSIGLFSLAYNFFAGGMLSAASGLRPFWVGCWRYLLANIGLGLILLLLSGALLLGGGLVDGFAFGGLGGGTITALLLIQLFNLLGEYGRAIGVARDRRNPFVLFGQACVFCARRLPGVLLLGMLGLLLHGLVLGLAFTLGTQLSQPLAALLMQQLVSLAFIWVKLLRLSWALAYVRAADGRGSAPAPGVGGPGYVVG